MRVDREIREKLFDESDTSFEARKLWYAFKDSIFYENRFFVRHQLLNILPSIWKRILSMSRLVKFIIGQRL